MNIRRLSLTLIAGALLLGGAGTAFAAPNPPSPTSPKTTNVGPQAGARAVLVPDSIGTKNTVTKREYTELAAPCRLYDSRSSTPLPSGGLRSIALTACPGIPTYATSLNVSLSATHPSHAGFMRVWANGAPEPAQTVLQWGTSSTTTGAAVTMSPTGLRVHSAGGPTDLVIDVAGYYTAAIYADVLPASTTAFADMFSSTSMISGYSSTLASPGDIVVSVRRNIAFCDIQATAESAGFHATTVQYSPTQFVVRVRDNAGNPARAYASVSVNC
ncbi:MAG: hypothetical protein QOG22_799 [Pseudonocardiales bacterium]|jgi:hypothetical protein|nr:hypothetical protein [Pseudonocardiales bacterium]MDT4970656.1 hypothetical protein [Pseudonocardiales bacterium]